MTITQKATSRQIAISIGLPLLLLFTLIIFALNFPWSNSSPGMATGLTLDFVFTVPLLYFLLIRKKAIPKWGVASLFVLGLVCAGMVIPADQQTTLALIETYLLPVVELGVVGLILYKVQKLVRSSRKLSSTNSDFVSMLKQSAQEVFPGKIGHLLSTEISVIYYGFFAWKKRSIQENEFSYHRKSGAATMYGVFIFMVLVETFAVHILVANWSHFWAWVLTATSIYVIFQIIAMLKAMPRRPIIMTPTSLELRNGLAADCSLPYDQIESIELSRRSIPPEEGARKIALSDMLDSHNVVLRLKNEVSIQGLYGQSKNAKILMVWVDDREAFYEAVQTKMSN